MEQCQIRNRQSIGLKGHSHIENLLQNRDTSDVTSPANGWHFIRTREVPSTSVTPWYRLYWPKFPLDLHIIYAVYKAPLTKVTAGCR